MSLCHLAYHHVVHHHDVRALTLCRVLHLCAPLSAYEPTKEEREADPQTRAERQHHIAGLLLPGRRRDYRYGERHPFWDLPSEHGHEHGHDDHHHDDDGMRKNRRSPTRRPMTVTADQRALTSRLSSRDIVQQLYLRNCALCVMSRFGPTDDIRTASATEMRCDAASNFELVEAVHLAGHRVEDADDNDNDDDDDEHDDYDDEHDDDDSEC